MARTQNRAGGMSLWPLMAATPQDDIPTFLENIPNIISEARCQLYSDNISVTEFNLRRLENSVYVMNILHQRSDERNEVGVQQLQDNFGVFCAGPLLRFLEHVAFFQLLFLPGDKRN